MLMESAIDAAGKFGGCPVYGDGDKKWRAHMVDIGKLMIWMGCHVARVCGDGPDDQFYCKEAAITRIMEDEKVGIAENVLETFGVPFQKEIEEGFFVNRRDDPVEEEDGDSSDSSSDSRSDEDDDDKTVPLSDCDDVINWRLEDLE